MKRLLFPRTQAILLGIAVCLWPVALCTAESIAQDTGSAQFHELSPEARGDLFMAHQEYVRAIEAYRIAPQNAAVWNKMGIAYLHLNAVGEARYDYQRALLIQPDYAQALNNLGATYFEERNYKKAIRLYRHAMKLMPHSAVIAANLGTAYFARGEFNKGFKAYHTAFALDPDVFGSADALPPVSGVTDQAARAHEDYCLAELFAEANMPDQAMEYLRRALDDGFSDHNDLLENAVFAEVRKTAQFAELMKEEGIHLPDGVAER